MKAPSVATLTKAFSNLSRPAATLIRKFAKGVDDRDELEELVELVPGTKRYVHSLHSSPYNSALWRETVALHAMNELIEGYGVEGLGPPRRGDYAPPFEYINMGDTYSATLIYDRDKDRLFVGSWGDVAERYEREWNGEDDKED